LGSFPALRTPANMLVMNLAVSDFLLMITLIPECVYNFFSGGPWQFGDLGCQIHAFCGELMLIFFSEPIGQHFIKDVFAF
jgi:r-opsin